MGDRTPWDGQIGGKTPHTDARLPRQAAGLRSVGKDRADFATVDACAGVRFDRHRSRL